MSAFFRFVAVVLFSLNLSAAPITGTVRDAARSAVAGALVEVVGARSVMTSQSGDFSVDLPAGSYYFQPGGNKHTTNCKGGGECMVYVHFMGAFDIKAM